MDPGEMVLKKCREIFDRFDRDGDGSLNETELGALLRSVGVTPKPSQIEALFRTTDRNSNGLIEFGEFLDLIGGPKKLQIIEEHEEDEQVCYSEKELVALFKAFDKDGNGYITAVELAHSMAKLGHPLSARELAEMMAQADEDGDGKISFDEFAAALRTQWGNT